MITSSLDALKNAVVNIEAHYHSVEAEAKAKAVPTLKFDHCLEEAQKYPYMTSFAD